MDYICHIQLQLGIFMIKITIIITRKLHIRLTHVKDVDILWVLS